MKCLLCVITLLSTTVWAAASEPATEITKGGVVVPEMPTADMHMSWTDFKELLSLIQPVKAKVEEKEVLPPFPWSISSAEYEADAATSGSVHIRATFQIQVWEKGWVSIPIIGTPVALLDVALDGAPSFLKQEQEWFQLVLASPGTHTLEMGFVAHTVEAEGTVHFEFPCAAAAITQMNLHLGRDAAGVTSPTAGSIRLSEADGRQEAELALRTSDTVQVSWTRPTQVRAKPAALPARVASEVLTRVEVTESVLTCDAKVDYEVLRGTVDRFHLQLPLEAIVLEVSGAGADWSSFEVDGMQQIQVALNHEASGKYPLQLRWEWPIAPDEPTLTVPRLITEDVARQTGRVFIAAKNNMKVSVSDSLQHLTRIAPDSQGWPDKSAPVLHAFRYGRPDYLLELEIRTEQPLVACEINTLATAGVDLMSLASNVQYNVLRGEVNRFTVALPMNVKLLGVEGADMEWTQSETDTEQTLTVNLNRAVQDSYSLLLHYEMPVQGNDTRVNVPELTVYNVARQAGHVAIATRGNVKVDVEDGVEGASRIDSTELPQSVYETAQSPILHAFEYLEQNYILPLKVQRLDDVAVRVASIDSAELTTVVAGEDMVITRARYLVRNNQRQFLRIDPGEGAEIWGAQVDGRVISPAKDTESETGVLIQLRKSHEGASGLGAFPVELIYSKRMGSPSGLMDTLSLTAPTTDILADAVSWEVFLPADRRFAHSEGDLEAVKAAPSLVRPNRGELRAGEIVDIRRLQEGIERFHITDINNPASSAVAQQKSFGGLGFEAASTQPSSTRLAGVLPVHINLPQTGVPYLFSRKLVPQGKMLSLQIRTDSVPFHESLGWLSNMMAFALGALLARLTVLALRQKKEALRTVLPLGLSGAMLWFMGQERSLNWLHLAVFLLLGAAAPALFRRFRALQEPARGEGN